MARFGQGRGLDMVSGATVVTDDGDDDVQHISEYFSADTVQ